MAAVQGNLQGPKVLEILEQAEKITKPDLFATPFVRAALVQGERKQLAKECDSDVLVYCWKREAQRLFEPIEKLHQSQCTCPGNEYWPLDSSFCAVQLFRCLSK